jgi:hypothetical protein
MKKRTILFIPPRGFGIKPFKIRLSVVIIVSALILVGFAGYFIPFDSFTLNVVEKNLTINLLQRLVMDRIVMIEIIIVHIALKKRIPQQKHLV